LLDQKNAAHALSTGLAIQQCSRSGQQPLLYQFDGYNDVGYPAAKLVFDASGNLYGTNQFGGTLVASARSDHFFGPSRAVRPANIHMGKSFVTPRGEICDRDHPRQIVSETTGRH
jgi:hypothetical protein